MPIPSRLKRVKKCSRCELLYPYNETLCTHCKELDDAQVEALKQKYEDEHEGNAKLGKLFFYAAILLLLLILALNSG